MAFNEMVAFRYPPRALVHPFFLDYHRSEPHLPSIINSGVEADGVWSCQLINDRDCIAQNVRMILNKEFGGHRRKLSWPISG
jgi:hypothetical protein